MSKDTQPGRLETVSHKFDVATNVALGAAAMIGMLEKTTIGRSFKAYMRDTVLARPVSESPLYNYISAKLDLGDRTDETAPRTYADDLLTLKRRAMDSKLGRSILELADMHTSDDNDEPVVPISEQEPTPEVVPEKTVKEKIIEALSFTEADAPPSLPRWQLLGDMISKEDLAKLLDNAEASDKETRHILVDGDLLLDEISEDQEELDAHFNGDAWNAAVELGYPQTGVVMPFTKTEDMYPEDDLRSGDYRTIIDARFIRELLKGQTVLEVFNEPLHADNSEDQQKAEPLEPSEVTVNRYWNLVRSIDGELLPIAYVEAADEDACMANEHRGDPEWKGFPVTMLKELRLFPVLELPKVPQATETTETE